VIYNNPFQPFLAVDNDDTPRATRHSSSYAPRRFDPFGGDWSYDDTPESRTAAAAKAIDQAERDLADARKRSAAADRRNERSAQVEREATLAERSRLVSILTSPVAVRHPLIAKKVAFESNSPADECISALEQYERDNTVRAIVHAARLARGEDPHSEPIIAGPKQHAIKMTPEAIEAASKRRRGEIVEDTMPPKGSLAWHIVMAARKARGQD
jgi:hypothetical protein